MKKNMDRVKKYDKYFLSIRIFIGVLLFVLILCFVTLIKFKEYRRDLLDDYIKNNNNSLEVAKSYIMISLKSRPTETLLTKNDILLDMSRLDTGYGKFWYFIIEGETLYYNGNLNLDDINNKISNNINQGIIKYNNTKFVYANIKLEYMDKTVYLGYTIDENFIFHDSGIEKSIIWIIIAFVFLVIILIATNLFMLNISRNNSKNIKKLENILIEKNITIENIIIESKRRKNKDILIKDSLTKTYNSIFMTKFFEKLNNRENINYKICALNIENKDLSDEKFEKIEIAIADLLMDTFLKDDIIVRFSKGIFIIIVLNYDINKYTNNMNYIMKYVQNNIRKDSVEIKIACDDSNYEKNIYETFGKILQKL